MRNRKARTVTEGGNGMQPDLQILNEHYSQPQLIDRLLGALKQAGKDVNTLTREDIFTFDEFHIRGREATRELAQAADLKEGLEVLDIGCGIGGPARTLAAEYGCMVVGLDLIDEYCRTATLLTERVGLQDRVRFQQGTALDLPFDDASFDVVWSQHVTMNIEDKRGMFAEIRRVLRPHGRLALHTICAGSQTPPYFPVPWANTPAISYLEPADDLYQLLIALGFTERVWQDVSEVSLAWFQQLVANMKTRSKDAPPPLGLNLLMGQTTPEKAVNVVRNLEEDRIKVVLGIFEGLAS